MLLGLRWFGLLRNSCATNQQQIERTEFERNVIASQANLRRRFGSVIADAAAAVAEPWSGRGINCICDRLLTCVCALTEQESCAIANISARCADKSKQTQTATALPKIT